MDDAEIALVDLTVLDLLVEDAQRLRVLGRDHDAAGIAVDAVAEGGRERVFLARAPLALGVEIGLNVVDERFSVLRAVVRMNGKAGLFIHEQDVFVLIDDVELWRGDGQIGVLGLRRFKNSSLI